MVEIALKMLLCLLLAALLGGIIGYIIGRIVKCNECEKIKNEEDIDIYDKYSNFNYEKDKEFSSIDYTPSKFFSEQSKQMDKDSTLEKIAKEDSGLLEKEEKMDKPILFSTITPEMDKPDDLKEISGIGLKLEKLLNELGVYYFSQIASWSEENLRWIDAHLQVFKGRAKRDNWIQQAKILAEGGETEFSKRVKKGEIERYVKAENKKDNNLDEKSIEDKA